MGQCRYKLSDTIKSSHRNWQRKKYDISKKKKSYVFVDYIKDKVPMVPIPKHSVLSILVKKNNDRSKLFYKALGNNEGSIGTYKLIGL